MRNFNSGHFLSIFVQLLIIQRYEKKQDCLESILIDKMIAEIDIKNLRWFDENKLLL